MHYKRLFSSDHHLGMWGASPEVFLKFLKSNTFDEIYLIGDFVDFWALNSSGSPWTKCWTKECNDIIVNLVEKMNAGTRVYYTPGNHDDKIQILEKVLIHKHLYVADSFIVSVSGAKTLITHGHQIDLFTQYAPWICKLGAVSYVWLIRLNKLISSLNPHHSHFSLSSEIKKRVKKVTTIVDTFEKGMTTLAQLNHANMVICGHIHTPNHTRIDGVQYINTGDFVESLSCVVETMTGRLELLKFNPQTHQSSISSIPLFQST